VSVTERVMELPRRSQDGLRQTISILKRPQNKATTSPSQRTATLAGDNITVERYMGSTEAQPIPVAPRQSKEQALSAMKDKYDALSRRIEVLLATAKLAPPVISETSGRTPSSPAIVRQDSPTPESPGEEVDYDSQNGLSCSITNPTPQK
jgi:hypothetical protein